MSFKRVGILLGKELVQGPKNFIFIWAIVAPIVISLVVSLVFGTLFSEKPRLGIVDEGGSELVTKVRQMPSVVTKEYVTVSEIEAAVESGAVDVGIVLPKGLDSAVKKGEKVQISAYVWGESLAKNRAILGVTIADLAREVAGQEAPVEIDPVTLGGAASIPWNDRLLPLIVLMAVFVGGMFLPATSLIDEKQKKTLDALLATPTSIADVYVAKGLLGLILSLLMGVVILILNQAFGAKPILLVLVLALGAIMATELGLILGAAMNDFTTLFATFKLGGILLWAPAIVYMFPQIPEVVAKVFPTYYLIQPILEIYQRGSGWPDIAPSIFTLIGLNLILLVVLVLALMRMKQYVMWGGMRRYFGGGH